MRVAVVDPRILIRAFAFPRSRAAQLLALFAYGRISAIAAGYPLDELDEMLESAERNDAEIDATYARAQAERQILDAKCRKVLIEEAAGQILPDDLLLVASLPLLQDLQDLAQRYQAQHSHVLPSEVRRLIAVHTLKVLTEVGIVPNYLTRGRVSRYDYLIHTATLTDARVLITDDAVLQLPGDASHRNPTTGRMVRPFSLEDFLAELPSILNLDEIDPKAILRAAVQRDPCAGLR